MSHAAILSLLAIKEDLTEGTSSAIMNPRVTAHPLTVMIS